MWWLYLKSMNVMNWKMHFFFSDRMISHLSEWYGFLFLRKPTSHCQRVLSKLVVKPSITKDLLTKSNMIWICWRPEFSIFLSILADMQLTGNVMYVPLETSGILQFQGTHFFSSGLQKSCLGLVTVLNCYFPNCVYGITLGYSLCNIFVMLCFNHVILLLFHSLLLGSSLSTRNKSIWLLVNLSVFCPL